MNYMRIDPFSISNGPGVRVALFVSGCRIHCPFCFNGDAWSFEAGQPFNEKVQNEILGLLRRPFCQGLTVLGGEPMEPENQMGLERFLERAHASLREGQDIWLFTGYVLDRDIIPSDGHRHVRDVTRGILDSVDVIVDGPFVNALKSDELRFRGSANQRVIDVAKSRRNGRITLWREPTEQYDFAETTPTEIVAESAKVPDPTDPMHRDITAAITDR